MINFFYRQSRTLLFVQLDQRTLHKDAAMQRVFRQVDKEGSKLDSFLCDGSSQ
ncbi:MAG: hypothetical protein ACI9IT_000489 [Glaciecola sp.]|jgi:hypothetical protein